MPEKGLSTRIDSARDQVPDCLDFTRAKNKLPSWDKYLMAPSQYHNIQKEREPNLKMSRTRENAMWFSKEQKFTNVENISTFR